MGGGGGGGTGAVSLTGRESSFVLTRQCRGLYVVLPGPLPYSPAVNLQEVISASLRGANRGGESHLVGDSRGVGDEGGRKWG